MTASFFFLHAGNQASLYYPQSGERDVYYDIHSGRGYQSLVSSDQVGLFFNTDGISPFKSSLTIWPIYLAFTNLPPSIRTNKANLVTCAFWVGQSKLPMKIFLKPIQTLLSRFAKKGVALSSSRFVCLKPLFGVLDLIAKAPTLNMKQHSGRHGCPVCVHPGTWDRTCVYLPENEHALRTHESMIQDGIELNAPMKLSMTLKVVQCFLTF